MDFLCQSPDGGEGVRFDAVAEASGKANRPQHAQLILCKSPLGVADGADYAGLQVGLAPNEIENFSRVVSHEQTVDGEIAARDIFFRLAGVDNLVRVTAIGIADVLPK